MSLKGFTVIWLVITGWLSFEYLAAHGYFPFQGLMLQLQCWLDNDCTRFDPRPGKPVSYFLGWLGFGIMALTNVYILKKTLAGHAKTRATPRLVELAHFFWIARANSYLVSL